MLAPEIKPAYSNGKFTKGNLCQKTKPQFRRP